MTICILGRQPELGLAELEALYGAQAVQPVGGTSALVDASVDFDRLGGTVKTAELLGTIASTDISTIFQKVVKITMKAVASLPAEGKTRLGISLYGYSPSPYDINGAALRLKKMVKRTGRSVRVVPSVSPALSSAQTFHNQLAGTHGLELVIIRDANQTLVGRVTNVQNIDAYRVRDRERPKRDAFVGMLPPKLAQIIVNLAARESGIAGSQDGEIARSVLDPFCGTGVVLQEALLMGYEVYGTDISPKMIDYTKANLAWLETKYEIRNTKYAVAVADATAHTWDLSPSRDLDISRSLCVASETYLGQPLGGQNPSKEKMSEIIQNTNAVIHSFLKNIHPQLPSGTRLCLAVPTWFVEGTVTRLPLTHELEILGFRPYTFEHVVAPLIYRREDQITGRELLVLERN